MPKSVVLGARRKDPEKLQNPWLEDEGTRQDRVEMADLGNSRSTDQKRQQSSSLKKALRTWRHQQNKTNKRSTQKPQIIQKLQQKNNISSFVPLLDSSPEFLIISSCFLEGNIENCPASSKFVHCLILEMFSQPCHLQLTKKIVFLTYKFIFMGFLRRRDLIVPA
jgi:hypothetical protein